MSVDTHIDNLEFPQDSDRAQERFVLYQTKDPFPDIPPALLNAKDIYHYARVAGIVHPFPHDDSVLLKKKLKPASYEIDFLGTVHYTDENGVHQREDIIKGKPFTLRKNTIVFVFVHTKFFLPNYIAIRFNLRINLVHKGLLLGTGPLVDPGFTGQLLIPLHNLTSEDYELTGGEGLIWVEFTKVSNSIPIAYGEPKNDLGFQPAFPSDKRNNEAQYYFNESSNRKKPAVSSIPGEVKEAKNHADRAAAANKKIKNWGGLALLALVVSLFALTINIFNLISAANNNVSTSRDAIAKDLENQAALRKQLEKLQSQVDVLSASTEKNSQPSKAVKSNSSVAPK